MGLTFPSSVLPIDQPSYVVDDVLFFKPSSVFEKEGTSDVQLTQELLLAYFGLNPISTSCDSHFSVVH